MSFTAHPGEVTAIVGGTGSGKSTLAGLIPRFYDANDGQVLLDGVDVREMAQADLRARIGFVPQTAVLFSGTVAANIRYGREDASDDEVRHAATVAQAIDFIEAMPEQFASPISQGGINLSGGQKQRLSIARAIVRRPDVYVFDDSFSALDFATDARLRAALRDETAHATVFIVAQRISTVITADRIVVLDEGRVVGIGTHAELLETQRGLSRDRGVAGLARRGRMSTPHGPPTPPGRPAARRAPRRARRRRCSAAAPMGGLGVPTQKAKNFKGTLVAAARLPAAAPAGARSWSSSPARSARCSASWARRSSASPRRRSSRASWRRPRASRAPGSISPASAGSCSGLVVLYVVANVFQYLMQYLMANVAQKTVYTLRQEVEAKFDRLPLKFFDSRTRGEVMSRAVNDLDSISGTLQQNLTQLLTSVLTLIGVIVMMLTISWILTLGIVLTLPLSLVIVARIAKRSQKFFMQQQMALGRAQRSRRRDVRRPHHRHRLRPRAALDRDLRRAERPSTTTAPGGRSSSAASSCRR